MFGLLEFWQVLWLVNIIKVICFELVVRTIASIIWVYRHYGEFFWVLYWILLRSKFLQEDWIVACCKGYDMSLLCCSSSNKKIVIFLNICLINDIFDPLSGVSWKEKVRAYVHQYAYVVFLIKFKNHWSRWMVTEVAAQESCVFKYRTPKIRCFELLTQTFYQFGMLRTFASFSIHSILEIFNLPYDLFPSVLWRFLSYIIIIVVYWL